MGSSNFIFSQNYVKAGENLEKYYGGADFKKNHVFTMSKTGANYDPLTIDVYLEKGKFAQGATLYGYDSDNPIPDGWTAEIISVNNGATINDAKTAFTFTGNPIANIQVNLKVMSGGSVVSGLENVVFQYRIEGPFTAISVKYNSCSGGQEFVLYEVSIGSKRPCAGTADDPKYNIKIFNAGADMDTASPVNDLDGNPANKTQVSNKFLFSLAKGDYSYKAEDGCGRSFTGTFTILEAYDIGAKVKYAGFECAADANGTAVLTIEGAERPLTWKLEKKNGDTFNELYNQGNGGANVTSSSDVSGTGSGNFTITINNLEQATYKFSFSDSNGCDKEQVFEVITPPAMAHELVDNDTETLQALLCSASVNGSFTFRGYGGWTSPFVGNVYRNDNENAETLWPAVGYTFTLLKSDGATPPTYSSVGEVESRDFVPWAQAEDGSQNGFFAEFDGLGPGSYILKMYEQFNENSEEGNIYSCTSYFDMNGMISGPGSATAPYQITVPAPLVVVEDEHIDISCFGQNDGEIKVSTSGGTPDYTYVWKRTVDGVLDGDFVNPGTEDLTGLSKGIYELTVTDANGCDASLAAIEIIEPSQLAAELDADFDSEIECYDGNGSIKINVTVSSTPPFIFSLTGTNYNGDNVNDSFTSADGELLPSHTFNVKAGTYQVTVTDSRNCSVDIPDTDPATNIELTQPDSKIIITGKVKADFDGTENGGTEFKNGDGMHMSCNGGFVTGIEPVQANGEINIEVTGGNAPYTYTWTAVSGDGSKLVAGQADQTGLTAGVYRVSVSDSSENGCPVTKLFIVSDPAPLTIPENDMLDADKPNYTYLGEFETSKYYLSNTSLTYMEARDIAASLGGYLVSIKKQEENQWLIDNDVLKGLSITNFWLGLDDIVNESENQNNKSRFKWNDGTSLDWHNFGSGEPNDVLKNSEDSNPGEDYIEFSQGTWNDIYHDTKIRFIIEFNPTQIKDFNGNSIDCNGQQTGEIDFTVTGGTKPYTYAWTKKFLNDAADDTFGEDTENITALGAGKYTIVVTDASGCTTTKTYTLTEPDELLASFDTDVSSEIGCYGEDGSLKVDLTQESTPPYTYTLTGTNYLDEAINIVEENQTVLTKTYPNLKAAKINTKYKVEIKDANGCTIEFERVLTQPDKELEITQGKLGNSGGGDTDFKTITCNGDDDATIDIEVDGGTPDGDGKYSYQWIKSANADFTDGDEVAFSTDQDLTDIGPGYYKVTVTDSNGCFKTITRQVTEPDALSLTENIYVKNGFNITCFGDDDGKIDIDVIGGTGVYTYQWTKSTNADFTDGDEVAYSTDKNIADLGPGWYRITVTDSNSCTLVKEFPEIKEPLAIDLSHSTSDFNGFDTSCNGAVDGEITLQVDGGVPDYTYSWERYVGGLKGGSGVKDDDFSANTKDLKNLKAGAYYVTVTDANLCPKVSDAFVIEEPPPLIMTSKLSDYNGKNISCFGFNDGKIEIEVNGGFLSPGETYKYEWRKDDITSAIISTEKDLDGLVAGKYWITITDSNNCVLETDIDIEQYDQIEYSGLTSDYNGFEVSIKGNTDGFINITPKGGTGDYLYEWKRQELDGTLDNTFSASTQNLEGLKIGKYTLTLTDSNGCTITLDDPFVLEEPNELLIDLGNEPTNILCYGEKTGDFKAIITQGSVPTYQYILNGKDYDSLPVTETVSSIKELNYNFKVKAGEYSITVVDLNGGTKTSAKRKFTQPDAPLRIVGEVSKFNNDNFNISCNGASDATIKLTVTGGTISGTDYDYTWSTTNGTNLDLKSKDQSKLGPGDYTVIVEDENGCTIEDTFTIIEPKLIAYTLELKKDITCFGQNDGSIDITVNEGTGIYDYTWSTEDGAGIVDPKSQDQSGLSKGTYKLILNDGCETLQYIYEIKEPDVLKIDLDEKVDILCFGEKTGILKVTVSGGTSPYSYEWEDNFGNKYNRDIGNVFNKGDLSNIPAGTYDLKVTDSNGCETTLEDVKVEQPDELKIDYTAVDVSCFNGNDGTINVTPSGGVAPYTYSWSDLGNGSSRTNLEAGKYTVTVTDNNNCVKSVEIEIKSAPQFNLTADVTPITCFGANDGSIKLTVDGGQAPITLEWADDPNAGISRTNLKSGVYSVLLTDSSGCEINEIYTITEPAKLQLSAITSDALDCDNPNSGSIDLQVVGGNPPYTYVWSSGETTEDIKDLSANNYTVSVTDSKGCKAEQTFSVVRPFDITVDLSTDLRVVCETRDVYQVSKVKIDGGVLPYTIKWSSGDVSGANGEIMETNKEGSYSVEITDDNGCSKTVLFDITLPKLGYPEFDYTSFYWETFDALTFNDPITFTNNSTENYLSVSWDFGDGNTSSDNDPVHTYEKKGSYDVTLYVTYLSGCIYEIKKTIYVGDSYEIELPNAFTPNADGLNDTFRPVYYGFKTVDLKVFDTWGTLIYSETADGAKMIGWNGTLNNKPATNGNYIYQVTGEAYNGETIIKNGPFTLLR